jgi:hypothetical protein
LEKDGLAAGASTGTIHLYSVEYGRFGIGVSLVSGLIIQALSIVTQNEAFTGFWGEFWHPIFKFGLTSIAKSTIPADARSLLTPTRRLLRLSIVFILSGIMHAAGSWTLANGLPSPLLDRNYPHLSFLTFVLQVPGIVFQQFIFQCCIPKLKNRVHRTSLKMAMLLFTCVWSLGTFPLIVADFAAGKLFQIPFLPVSIFGIAMKIYEGN